MRQKSMEIITQIFITSLWNTGFLWRKKLKLGNTLKKLHLYKPSLSLMRYLHEKISIKSWLIPIYTDHNNLDF